MTSASTRPWIIAHRGARDEAPENTGAAFDRALQTAVDGIELDVQLSADDVPVLFHDRTLWKIAGSRRRVSSLSLEQLQELDWGGWYHPSFSGEPLLTLKETLQRYLPHTRLFIEIKYRSRDRRQATRKRLAQAVVDLLQRPDRARHAEKHAFLLSFDTEVLFRALAAQPRLRCVWNLPEKTAEQAFSDAASITNRLWGCCVRRRDLTRSLVRKAHDRGLRCFTYSCNTPRQVRAVLPLRPDAILTDRPAWLCRFMAGVAG
jgi:glycerophosphoryl diester phosphodiesterase